MPNLSALVQARNFGFSKMIDKACDSLADKGLEEGKISEKDKSAVKGLLCESFSFVSDIAMTGEVSPIEAGVHLAKNGINIGKLSESQQIYCHMLRAEIGLNLGELALAAAATFEAASYGATGGVIAGGITGTVTFGPAGTAVGAAVGGVAGAAVPLAIGSAKMYEKVSKITDAAIDYHGQCGPLASDKVKPWRNVKASMDTTVWTGADHAPSDISSTA